MPPLTARENRILRGLHPHTRKHTLALMARHPAIHLSSGKRTARRNKEVGGALKSWHLVGRAVDFIGPKNELVLAYVNARDMRVGMGCTGPEEVILEDLDTPNQHLHVAW